jgi:hypothetical protein
MKSDDINRAKKNIKTINTKGKEIIEAQPFLRDMEFRLDWCQQIIDSSLNSKEELLKHLEPFVDSVNNITLENFTVADASGSVGIGATGTSIATSFITEYSYSSDSPSDNESKLLIDSINNYNLIKNRDDQILRDLVLINEDLKYNYKICLKTYIQWKKQLKSSSDLAKDLRTFLEEFKGKLNKLRVDKKLRDIEKIPSFSWNKMAKCIKKKSRGTYDALLIQKTIHETLHDNLSTELKTFKEADIDHLFQTFQNHIYSVLNLIDKSVF